MPTNLYNYKIPKSGNEETSFFLTKGRITLKALLLRFFLCIIVYAIFYLIYAYYAVPNNESYGRMNVYDTQFKSTFTYYKNFVYLILPVVLLLFISIQAIKRLHDVNKSGWLLFYPGYNLILLFSNSTVGNNDFGIDPRPQKNVEYFDQLKK
jgi:uncharacterized membrane protein YhaH (DUF805 family)